MVAQIIVDHSFRPQSLFGSETNIETTNLFHFNLLMPNGTLTSIVRQVLVQLQEGFNYFIFVISTEKIQTL